jgi:hypothetical protein
MRTAIAVLSFAFLTLAPPLAFGQVKPEDTFASRFPSSIVANVRVDLTISDQTGTAPPETKSVSMIVANGSWGKMRASASAFQKGDANREVPVGLNVDARPFISRDGDVRLEMTLVYSPFAPSQAAPSPQMRPTELNHSATVVLHSGKPLTVTEAADPIADRKMVVTVVATILK